MLYRDMDSGTHLRASVGDTDIAAGVALLRELTGEELVEFSVEDTVSHELALLADLARHFVEESSKHSQLIVPGSSKQSQAIHRAI
jgi:hypothetical protein